MVTGAACGSHAAGSATLLKNIVLLEFDRKKKESSDDVDAIGGGTGGPHGPSPPLLFLGGLAPHFLLSNFA